MKTKTLSLFAAGIFLMIILGGVASAAVFEMNKVSEPSSVAHDAGSFDVLFNITYTGSSSSGITVGFGNSSITSGSASITNLYDTPLNQNETKTLTATVVFDPYQSGIISGVIYASPSLGSDANFTFAVPITPSSSLSVSDSSVPSGENSTIVSIKNTGNVNLNNIQLSASGDFDVSINPATIASLAAGESENVTVSVITDMDDLKIGSNSVTLTAASGNASDSGTLSVYRSYCEYDDLGNLNIKIEDFTNNGISGTVFGEDKDWFPLDEIEVEIEVENDGNDDIDDIVVEWGLYNEKTGEWIIDDEEKDFNLKDGDRETLRITFNLDKNVDELNDNGFVFYAKATGEDDEFGGNETCMSDSEDIEVVVESDFVVLNDLKVPETVQCGGELQLTAEVWNIGDDDQEDVYVSVYNRELGIDEKVIIGDIDAFEDEKLDTLLKIPEDAEEKDYTLRLWVYDEDNEVYRTDYDDDDSEFTIPVRVEGSCIDERDGEEAVPDAAVSASLESGGVPGEEMIIRATITNTGDESSTYRINAAGYAEWASSAEVAPNALILGSGDSGEVLFTFDVIEDVEEGEKSFDIEVVSDGEMVIKQPVSVVIEGKQGLGIPGGITGRIISGENWYLWGVGLLNIILVIIIIAIAVRIARKS